MRGQESISNGENVIDSRDVIARIHYIEISLETEWECPECHETITVDYKTLEQEGHIPNCEYYENEGDPIDGLEDDEREEYTKLLELQDQCEGYCDWKDGAILIRDSYFKQYAHDLADELGLIQDQASWPYTCIDWDEAADELRQDYTSVEFDGEDYWVR